VLIVFLLVAVLAVPLTALPQGSSARVGILGPDEEPRFSQLAGGLRQGLREHGQSEPQLRLLESRVARGDRASARRGIVALLDQRPDVLFVIGSELVRVVRDVSATIPLVFITPGDPVTAGLVSSLARPGANMTGVTFEYPELSGKRLELLKEIAPGIRHVLAMFDPHDASPRQGLERAREAARKLGLTLVERPVTRREDIARGLEALAEAQALLLIPGGVTSAGYGEMIRAANARRVPSVVHASTGSTAEALVSYGTSDVSAAGQAARLVDKILRGARAGELPVERPTSIRLVLNLRTAQALGLALPAPLLLRADEVIR
jgi:putative ABC transport system substrate-binding protein